MLKSMLVSVAIVMVAAAGASADVKPGSDVVLFGGASHSNFAGADGKALLGSEKRIGYIAGLGLMLRLNEDYGFETGLRLVQKGGKGTVDVTDYTGPNNGPTIVGEGTTRLMYAEIPLLLAVTFPTGTDSYLRAFGGPSFNILTSANFEGTIEDQQEKVDLKNGIKNLEAGFVFGAGWTYDAGEASMWLDARWDMGFRSIDDTGKDRDIKTQTWQFALGVGIPLAR